MTNQELLDLAATLVNKREVTEGVFVGSVATVLETTTGKIFKGVSIHACCGVGFCAEHSAIAAMVTEGEFVIKRICAVSKDNTYYPPCGRCRELMFQMSAQNLKTEVILSSETSTELEKL